MLRAGFLVGEIGSRIEKRSRCRLELAFSVLLVASVARSAAGTTLVVTSVAGTVNGDTSSPTALIANPGPDGISLVEAVVAANHMPGPHTVSFSQALAGQTIHLANGLGIERDGVTIIGFNDVTGKPAITLDASAVTSPFSLCWHPTSRCREFAW